MNVRTSKRYSVPYYIFTSDTQDMQHREALKLDGSGAEFKTRGPILEAPVLLGY